MSRIVALLALFAAALGVAASSSPAGFGLEEEYGLGWLFRLRGPRPAPAEVAIVRLDGATFGRLHELGADRAGWPEPLRGCALGPGGLDGVAAATDPESLPRGFHACLVRELTRRGAAVIAFDVSFRPNPAREPGTPVLAAALRAHGRVVLLRGAKQERAVHGRAAGQVQVDALDRLHPELAAAAAASATFVLYPVGNRVHQFWAFNRAVPLPTQLPTRALELLAADAVARFAAATGGPAPAAGDALRRGTEPFRDLAARFTPDAARRAGLAAPDMAPLEALARVHRGPDSHYLNFYGPPGSFAWASAADLLLPEPGRAPGPVALRDLRGKVVFVGLAEPYQALARDSYASPFSRDGIRLSGVEIAATGFANLLRGETVRVLPEWARLLLVGLLGAAMVLASCTGPACRGLAATLLLAVAYAAAAAAAFAFLRLWLPVVVPLLLLLPLALGLSPLVRYLGAARWLTIYTPRCVGQQLLQGREPGEASLLERRDVTVLLTDIAGYTGLAERSSPEAMTEFVNRHFTTLTACVEEEAGVVAQFVGDGLMAFWGAPDPQPDHAARACRAALAIRDALEDDNRRRAARGEPPVRVRIGVNTGVATAGNIGAPGRRNYGVVGDTVNTTQRIEQLGKSVCRDDPGAAAILVSAATREGAGDAAFRFADAGDHAVRNRQEPVRVFRLVGQGAPPVVVRLPRPPVGFPRPTADTTAPPPRWRRTGSDG